MEVCSEGLSLSVPFPMDPCHGFESEQGQGFTAGLAQELPCLVLSHPEPLWSSLPWGKHLVQGPVLCPSRISPLHCPGCCPASVSLVCVKQKLRLTEAAFPRAVQSLADASRCDPKKNKRERA